MNKVALFDFCETIANFQTADAYVDYVRNNSRRSSSRIYKIIHTILAKTRVIKLLSILLPKSSINKRIYALQLRGIPSSELDFLGKGYYEDIIRPNLIHPVIEELKRLQEKGYRIVLVSGGYDLYLKYFANEYGISNNDLICTNFIFSKGVCTGRFLGKDCLYEEKVRRLNLKMKSNQRGSIAFSDSQSDAPMLEWADEGIVVRNVNKNKCVGKINH